MITCILVLQLAQEKLDLQKCLLYFEREKGRPSDLSTKRVMKPLYDRYRAVRRLVRLSSKSAVRQGAVNGTALQRARSSGAAPESGQVDRTETRPPPEMTLPPIPPVKVELIAPLKPAEPAISVSDSPAPALSQTDEAERSTSTATRGDDPGEQTSVFLDWDISLAE